MKITLAIGLVVSAAAFAHAHQIRLGAIAIKAFMHFDPDRPDPDPLGLASHFGGKGDRLPLQTVEWWKEGTPVKTTTVKP